MRKLFGVFGTVAVLAWAIPAFALVSDTNITSTNGQPLGGATLSLVTHHANGAHHNYSGQVAQNGHARVAINTKEDKPNTGVTVDIQIVKDGVTYTADGVPLEVVLNGGPISVTPVGAGGSGYANVPSVYGATPNGGFPGGFFAGGHVSGGNFISDVTERNLAGMPTNNFSPSNVGMGGGATIGYGGLAPSSVGPFQLSFSPFVAADFFNTAVSHPFTAPMALGENIKTIVTGGVQMPFLQSNTAMVYLLGGVAAVEKQLYVNFLTSASETKWAWGGTAGLGMAIMPLGLRNVALFAQYQYITTEDVTFDRPASSTGFNYRYANNMSLFTGGITVYFGQ